MGRRDGRTEGSSTVKSLQGDLEAGKGRWRRGQPKSRLSAPHPYWRICAILRRSSLPWHAVASMAPTQRGTFPATDTTVRAGQKAWCLGTEEALPKNISNYLHSSGSQ